MSGSEEERSAKAFAAWQAVNAQRATATASQLGHVDWTKVTLDPKNIGVEFGPALTEEQFRAYCQQTGTKHQVLKMPSQKKS